MLKVGDKFKVIWIKRWNSYFSNNCPLNIAVNKVFKVIKIEEDEASMYCGRAILAIDPKTKKEYGFSTSKSAMEYVIVDKKEKQKIKII